MIASGYKYALHLVDWDLMYKRFDQPNDLLVRLNVFTCRVVDIPIEPIYNIGEQSKIRISKVIYTISWLLLKLFM